MTPSSAKVDIPAEYGRNLIMVRSKNKVGYVSRSIASVMIDDKDKLKSTQNDLFLADINNNGNLNTAVKAIDYKVLHKKNMYGEFGASSPLISSIGKAHIKLLKEGRFGRFERPFMVLDDHPVEGLIDATGGNVADGPPVIVGNPGETVALSVDGKYNYKLYVEGLSIFQLDSGNTVWKSTHKLLEKTDIINSFKTSVYLENSRADIEEFEFHIISGSGTPVNFGGGVDHFSIPAQVGNVIFDLKGKSFNSASEVRIVKTLPDGKRYSFDGTNHNVVLFPGDTLITTAGDLESRAIYLRTKEPSANDFEAVTGITPTVAKEIPVKGMSASAEVLMHSRQLKLSYNLFSFKGKKLAFGLTATYRSGINNGSYLGEGWTLNTEQYFYKLENSSKFLYHGPDGIENEFPLNGSKLDIPPGYAWDVSINDRHTEISVKDVMGLKSVYAVMPGKHFYRIQSQTDRYGNSIRYKYNEDGVLEHVIDDMDRKYTFHFIQNPNGAQRLLNITDFAGTEYGFAYHADGKLAAAGIINPEDSNDFTALHFAYQPTDNKYLQAVYVNNDANPYMDFVYVDNTSFRTHKVNTGSGTQDRAVDRFESSQYVDPEGRSTTYYFNTFVDPDTESTHKFNYAWSIDRGNSSIVSTKFETSESVLRHTKITYPNNNYTRYDYNTATSVKRGLINSVANYKPNGNLQDETSYSYSDLADCTLLFRITEPENKQTTYVHDAKGNITQIIAPKVTLADGSQIDMITEALYNEFGQPIRVKTPEARITWMQYFDTNDAYQDHLDREGLLKRTITTVKRGETYPVDAPENARQSDHYIVTDYAYDLMCNPATKTDAEGRSTISQFDSFGLVTDVYTVPIVGNNRSHTHFDYDGYGNTTKVTKKYAVPTSIDGSTAPDIKTSTVDIGYDQFLREVSTTTNGLTMETRYDGSGKVIGRQAADGVWTSYFYDEIGRQVGIRYNSNGPGVDSGVTGETSYKTVYDYDSMGRIHQEKRDSTILKAYTYDDLEHSWVFVQYPRIDNATIHYIDDEKRVTSTKTGTFNDNTTVNASNTFEHRTFTYNEIGGIKTATNKLWKDDTGAQEDVVYTFDNKYTDGTRTEVNPADPTAKTITKYDLLDRPIEVTHPDGSKVVTEYNKDGTVAKITTHDATSSTDTTTQRSTTFTYNNAGMMTAETLNDGSTETEYVYDGEGRVIFAKDASGKVTKNEYDILGRLVKVTTGFGSDPIVSDMEYYDNGRLKKVSKGTMSTTYEYDDLGNVTKVTHDLNGTTETEEFSYNSKNQLEEYVRKDSGNNTVSHLKYIYDANKELLTSITDGSNNPLRTFDDFDYRGIAKTVTEHNLGTNRKVVATTFEFDSFGQIVSDTHDTVKITSFNDKLGNRTKMESFKNSLSFDSEFYAYDNMTQITKVGPDSAFNDHYAYTYNGFGKTGKVELKNTTATLLTVDNGFDTNSRFASKGYSNSLGTVNYSRYDNGLIQNHNYTQGTKTYGHTNTFDDHNRLTDVDYTADNPFKDDTFTLDNLDNITNRSTADTPMPTDAVYTIEKAIRLANVATTPPGTDYDVTHDGNGNISEDDKFKYTWDEFNRIANIENKDQGAAWRTMSFSYDALGRLIYINKYDASAVELEEKKFVYDGYTIIHEYVNNGLSKSFDYGANGELLGFTKFGPEESYHYVTDEQDNVIAIADASFNIVEHYDYDAFGKVIISDGAGTVLTESSVDNNFAWGGLWREENTGLYLSGGNLINPIYGRSLGTTGSSAGETSYAGLFAVNSYDGNMMAGIADIDAVNNAVFSAYTASEMKSMMMREFWRETIKGWATAPVQGGIDLVTGETFRRNSKYAAENNKHQSGLMFALKYGRDYVAFNILDLVPGANLLQTLGIPVHKDGTPMTRIERVSGTLSGGASLILVGVGYAKVPRARPPRMDFKSFRGKFFSEGSNSGLFAGKGMNAPGGFVPRLKVRIQKINGRYPINSKYAGKTHPSGVRFNKKGFPDFEPYAKAQLELDGLTGVPRIDNKLANQAAGFGNSAKAPKGYTWHHVEDGLTMQLVPLDIHNATRHTGGAAVIRSGGL